MDASLKNALEFLLKKYSTQHIPLIYVVAPLAVIAVILVGVLLIICCKYMCCDDELHVVPSFVQRRTVRQVALDDEEAATPSTLRNRDSTSSHCVSGQLDPEIIAQINAVYQKRNYVSLRRNE